MIVIQYIVTAFYNYVYFIIGALVTLYFTVLFNYKPDKNEDNDKVEKYCVRFYLNIFVLNTKVKNYCSIIFSMWLPFFFIYSMSYKILSEVKFQGKVLFCGPWRNEQ